MGLDLVRVFQVQLADEQRQFLCGRATNPTGIG